MAITQAADTAERNNTPAGSAPDSTAGEQSRRGRWRPGTSGNPSGRPRGSHNRTTLAAQAVLEGEAERLTRKAVELALEGDRIALRLCIERIVPIAKDRPLLLQLPEIETAADVTRGVSSVLAAVAEGSITPSEGQAVSAVLELQRKAIETEQIEARIAAIEKAMQDRGGGQQ